MLKETSGGNNMVKEAVKSYLRKVPGLVYLFRKAKRLVRRFQSTEAIFRRIYTDKFWLVQESVSGPGSGHARTETIRREIPILLRELGVSSLLDIPCGDFHSTHGGCGAPTLLFFSAFFICEISVIRGWPSGDRLCLGAQSPLRKASDLNSSTSERAARHWRRYVGLLRRGRRVSGRVLVAIWIFDRVLAAKHNA